MASVVPPTRGVSFTVTFPVMDTSGKLKTGATFSAVQISKDGGSYVAATNSPAELATTSGSYTLLLTAAEMTADTVAVRFVISTASTQDAFVLVYTTAYRIDDLGAALANVASTVWAYVTRTLTQAAASVLAAVQGSRINVYKGATWSITLTGLTDFTGWTRLYFTVKGDRTNADSAALLQIRLTNPSSGDGLLILNGAVYGANSDAAIVVNSTTSITITVKPAATAQLATAVGLAYDVKAVRASDVIEVSDGTGQLFITSAATASYT